MRAWLPVASMLVMAMGASGTGAHAQTPAEIGAATPLRVFIDCAYYCDMDFMRTELAWVSYMRDRTDAQVHVLVTRENTGGGGGRYTASFIGLREFEGSADTLVYTASSDATQDMVRRGLTRTMALGLVGFAARTPYGQRLNVTAAAQPPGPSGPSPTGPPQPPADPWDFWNFTVGLSGFGNAESTNSYYYLNGSISANRTTDAWKLNLRMNGNRRQNTFEYEVEGEPKKTVSTFEDYGASTVIVKSLGSHVSAGFAASISKSTYGNSAIGLSIGPAIEYNFLPYAESTRRQLTVRYSSGVRYADYREVTIYGETQETRPVHGLEVGYATTQPWGRMSIYLDSRQYLHDRGKYNAGVGASTDIRLFRGFTLDLSGEYTRVRDQLNLPGRDLTEEEILLQQRQQATNYEVFFQAGISYRFGSIFNNVVNPRFGSGSNISIL